MSKSTAKTATMDQSRWIALGVLGLGAVLTTTLPSFAESHEKIIISHGYNEFEDLKYGPGDVSVDYVNPDAPTGGEFSIATIGTFDSMNPYATGIGTPGALSSAIYEDMMISTVDEVGSSYCLLCETIEYPESEDWVIFNLRTDVTFSDGHPFDSEDIAFSFDLLRTQGTPSIQTSFEREYSYEILGPHRIKFMFAEGFPRKNKIIQMGSLPAFPKHWYDETGARLDESRLEIGPGTAEYMLDSIDVGRRLTYKRNPDYWGKDHYLQVGHGNYDSIRIEYFGDAVAALEGFKAGEVTFRRENSSLNWATAYDFPALDKGWVVKSTLPNGALPSARGFIFNMKNEKLQNRSLRRAIGMMFNFTWTNENLQYGLFSQREAFWENERLKATGLPEGRELELLEPHRSELAAEIFDEPAYLPHESGQRPLDRRNLRAALALMAEAGYTPGDDGMLRDANGKTLDLEFIEDQQSMDRIILPYIENLKSLGVNITYNRIDPAQYQNRTQNKTFEMRDAVYRVGLIEGTGLSQRFGCEDSDDVFNPAGLCHPVIDALAESLLDATTYDELAAHIRAIDRVLRYEYFMIPVWTLSDHWVAHYDMYGRPDNLPPFSLGHLDLWWIDQDKEAALKAAGALR